MTSHLPLRRSSGSSGALGGGGSRMTFLEDQLQGLRESVRRERERRGLSGGTGAGPSGSGSGSGVGTRPIAKHLQGMGSARQTAGVGAQGRRASIPKQRHATAAAASPAPSAQQPSGGVDAALRRIQAFDLFSGCVEGDSLTAVDVDDTNITFAGEDALQQAKRVHDEDFEMINTYRYEEETAGAGGTQQQQQALSTSTSTSSATSTTAVKKRVRLPQPPPPPQGRQQQQQHAASPMRMVGSTGRCAPQQQQQQQESRGYRGGVWDLYELPGGGAGGSGGKTRRGGGGGKKASSLRGAGDEAGPSGGTPASSSAASPAAAQTGLQSRIADLQQVLLSQPETGGDIRAHQRRQREALEEMQRLQGWGPQQQQRGGSASAGTCTAEEGGAEGWADDSAAPSPQQAAPTYQDLVGRAGRAAAGGGGGGGGVNGGAGHSLLDGTFDEAENQRQFQEALRQWRGGGGGGGGAAGGDGAAGVETATAASGPAVPLQGGKEAVAGRLKPDFLQGLAKSSEFVYFCHLLQVS